MKIASWVQEQTANGGQAEFVVVLAQQADLSAAETLATKEEKGRFVRDALWNTAQATQASTLAWLRSRGLEYRSYYIVNAIWTKGSFEDALALASLPEVARIDGNPVINNLTDPLPVTEPTSNQPSAVAAIEPGISYSHAPDVWATGFTGQGVVVGGADTGYRWTHAAIKNKYRGWNGTTADHNYNWHDSIHSGGGSCGANSPAPCDDSGHGTHTIGTVTGSDSTNTNQIGMAPGAKWIGCRNMDQGNGTPATYMECLEFFLAPYPVGGTTAQGDPTKAPDVTTNSWTCPASEGCSLNTLQQAFDAQRAAGIMTVAAAGNSGPSCSSISDPPAVYDSVYTVGALNTGSDNIASFSSRGPVTAASNRLKPNISAPGTSTRSSYNSSDTAYASLSGTSMATPHVAGAVALLLSARPALRGNPAAIAMALNQGAVHLLSSNCDGGGTATYPNNTYGYGRMDAKAAVDSVLQITAAVSRKSHAGVPYDLDLLTPPAIESRGLTGDHTLVFTFSGNVTAGNAGMSSGTGSFASTPAFSGNTMTVSLTGVTDAQTISIDLSNVAGSTTFLPTTRISLGVLLGDVNGDRVVNAGDATVIRNQSGQTVDATNFRSDYNLDGFINSADATIARSRSGISIP